MSVSQHPIALSIEKRVDGPTQLLATVMALPLIDGIFPAIVIAGVLASPFGVLETGLLIFGGSATMAVILAEMQGSPRKQAMSILLIGAIIVPVAAIQAALAMTFDSLLNLEIFKRFAGLVILAIAAKTASSKLDEYLPGAGVIIALGLVASLEPQGAAIQLTDDMGVALRGAAAAMVGVLFALGVAMFGPHLRGRVDIDRFRFGSAVALGVLALPILGVLQTDAPIALAVLAVTALLAYDPDSSPTTLESVGDSPNDSTATAVDASMGKSSGGAQRHQSPASYSGKTSGPNPAATVGAAQEAASTAVKTTAASITSSSLQLGSEATPSDREIAARGAVATGYPGVNRSSNSNNSAGSTVSNGGHDDTGASAVSGDQPGTTKSTTTSNGSRSDEESEATDNSEEINDDEAVSKTADTSVGSESSGAGEMLDNEEMSNNEAMSGNEEASDDGEKSDEGETTDTGSDDESDPFGDDSRAPWM